MYVAKSDILKLQSHFDTHYEGVKDVPCEVISKINFALSNKNARRL